MKLRCEEVRRGGCEIMQGFGTKQSDVLLYIIVCHVTLHCNVLHCIICMSNYIKISYKTFVTLHYITLHYKYCDNAGIWHQPEQCLTLHHM